MVYVLRPMREEDIPQVTAIDRDAFPETWPPLSFRHELQNRLARYLVTWDTETSYREWAERLGLPTPSVAPGEGRLARTVRRLLGSPPPASPAESQELLAGYLGLWVIVEETHIVNVGVRTPLRGRGIGELLLLGALELSLLMNCRQVTLECRVSNVVAQNLYKKYAFRIVGRRKGYYTDNNEDAYVMTTDPIDTPEYRALLDGLRARHSERWGVCPRYLE